MKLIIAGSRTINSLSVVGDAFRACPFWDASEIVSGGAGGVDAQGDLIAAHYHIPIKLFRANWEAYGSAAGPIRNRAMAEYADALLLVWDGKSPGSRSMKAEMQRLGKPIHEVITTETER